MACSLPPSLSFSLPLVAPCACGSARVHPSCSQVWLNTSSLNRLQYDKLWGGIIACGCSYDNCKGKCKPHCTNKPTGPSCPALADAGMNFGNAYYNDHHFHYGYHVRGLPCGLRPAVPLMAALSPAP